MRMPTMTPTRSLLLEMLALVVLASLLAAGMNVMRPRPLPWLGSGDPEAEALAAQAAQAGEAGLPAGVRAIDEIGTAAAMGLAASGAALFVDARYPEDFAAGHVPGAVNVPPGMFEEAMAALLGPPPGERPLVVYCSSVDCPLSHELALALDFMGYETLRVYPEGWLGWTEAGGETEVAK